MKFGIQLYIAVISLSKIIFILEIFGVNCSRSTIHNRVYKAGLQPETGQCSGHAAVDETVI